MKFFAALISLFIGNLTVYSQVQYVADPSADPNTTSTTTHALSIPEMSPWTIHGSVDGRRQPSPLPLSCDTGKIGGWGEHTTPGLSESIQDALVATIPAGTPITVYVYGQMNQVKSLADPFSALTITADNNAEASYSGGNSTPTGHLIGFVHNTTGTQRLFHLNAPSDLSRIQISSQRVDSTTGNPGTILPSNTSPFFGNSEWQPYFTLFQVAIFNGTYNQQEVDDFFCAPASVLNAGSIDVRTDWVKNGIEVFWDNSTGVNFKSVEIKLFDGNEILEQHLITDTYSLTQKTATIALRQNYLENVLVQLIGTDYNGNTFESKKVQVELAPNPANRSKVWIKNNQLIIQSNQYSTDSKVYLQSALGQLLKLENPIIHSYSNFDEFVIELPSNVTHGIYNVLLKSNHEMHHLDRIYLTR